MVKTGSGDTPSPQPWFAPARAQIPGRAAIIGAGIAGTSAAQALRRRGWDVTLIDRHGAVGMEASGNPVGVLMPRLTAGDHLEGRFHAAAWLYALRACENAAVARCGVLQLATDEQEAARLRLVAERGVLPTPYLQFVDAAAASDIAGCTLRHPGLHFPQGGWVVPHDLCAALAADTPVVRANVTDVVKTEDGWKIVTDDTTIATVNIVILANALQAKATVPWLPLTARRGQITLLPPTTASAPLRTVIAAGAYLTPVANGRHCIGATFDWMKDDEVLDVRAEDHARNLADISATVPGLFDEADINAATGRVGVRCMTPDHLPLVGPVPDQARYHADYAGLRHGQHWLSYPPATYLSGLYVFSGLGARGLVTAPLAAEMLACHVAGAPQPLDSDLVTALHPARFLVRDLKRLKA